MMIMMIDPLLRFEALERRLKEQEIKEAEETAALEKMVRQVEHNLKAALVSAAVKI